MDSEKINTAHRPFEALEIGAFRWFVAYRFFFTFGLQMLATIAGWQIWAMTHSKIQLGYAGLVEAIPSIGMALYAGHIADKYARKKVALGAMIFIQLSVLGLLIGFWLGRDLSFSAFIFAALFGVGFGRSFMAAASFASLGTLIPKEKMSNAVSWSSTIWQMGMITGPAAGGLFYSFLSSRSEFAFEWCYAVVLAFLFVGFLAFSRIPIPHVPPVTQHEKIWDRLTSGLKYVFQHKVLLSAFSLDLFAVLFGGAVAILPVFADEVLKAGAVQLGWLRAAPAIGSAGMAMMLAFRKPMKNAGKNLLWAVFGFGICMIGFGLSTHFWVAFFFLFFSGVLDSISVVIRNTITQLYTPDEMRGRVSAVSSMFIGSSNEIGAFESGLAAQSMGLVPSLLFGGSMTIMIVGMIAWKAPALRALSLRDPQQE